VAETLGGASENNIFIVACASRWIKYRNCFSWFLQLPCDWPQLLKHCAKSVIWIMFPVNKRKKEALSVICWSCIEVGLSAWRALQAHMVR